MYVLRFFRHNLLLSGVILASFMSITAAGCKDAKKSKSKKTSNECDPNDAACLEQKRRDEEAKNLQNSTVTTLNVTIKGLSKGATVDLTGDDSVAMVVQVPAGIDPANLITGILRGPSIGLGIQGATTLYTSALPAGTHPITILVRDRAKCQSNNGTDCAINPDNMGRFTQQLTLNPAYDTQFDFTLNVSQGTGTGGTVQPPGQPTGFFGTLWNNIKTGVQSSWIWNWLKGLGNKP